MSLLKFLARGQGGPKPDRDWRFLFGGFLILVLTIFAATIYLYRFLDTLEAISHTRMTMDPTPSLNRAALEAVAQNLAKKQNRFDELLTAPPAIVDPAR